MFNKLPHFRYSDGLHQYLLGMAIDCSDYTNQNIYQLISIWIFGVCVVVTINYYFGFLDRPKFSNITYWVSSSIVVSAFLGLFAYYKAANGLSPYNHCSELSFYRTDCILFGLTAFAYSNFIIFIFSMIFKWFSTDNKKVPF